MAAAKTRILFLAICAGDAGLIRELARQGEMPTFARLLRTGLVGRTMGPPGFFVQSIWPSFYTGMSPAGHGVHSWQQLRNGTYEFYRAFTPECVQATPFWDHLSAAGRRCAVLDIPHSRPSEQINGIQLVEWGAHDSNHGFLAAPASLAEEVVARFGVHPQRGMCDAVRGPQELRAFADSLHVGITKKTALTRHFLNRGGWDFFAQVYTEAHCAGHQTWHLHDPGHPRHSDEARRIAGDPLVEVYRAIDAGMAEVLAEVGEDTLIVVLASHGMGPKHGAQFMLEDILLGLGLAEPPRPGPQPSAAKLRGGIESVLAGAWGVLPGGAKSLLRPLRDAVHGAVHPREEEATGKIDPAASTCFIIINNNTHGGIRINLAGREPAGKVKPGPEFEALLDEISRALLEIKNLETGKRIATRVMRTDRLYKSAKTAHFPDLMVEWSQAAPVRKVGSPRLGRLDKIYDYNRTGEHSPAGMFIATGRGIAPRQIQRTISIMDFAPTFCALLGAHGHEFEGRPIDEILTGATPILARHRPMLASAS